MIGLFDSGLGGLTILNYFIKKLPQYDYVYLGDSARAPYGNKSDNLINTYTQQAVNFLFKEGCELLIIACNTASAKALRNIQQKHLPKRHSKKRVLGVVIPVAEKTAEVIKNSNHRCRIGIIGTRATIASGVYEEELNKASAKEKIYKQACPLLVPLVEEGWANRREAKMILRYYLRPLKDNKVNTLILACTHYPILYKQIKQIMGKQCRVLNSPEYVAEKLERYLLNHPEIEKKLRKNKKRIFYTTDDAEKFKSQAEKFLSEKIKIIKKINL